MRGGTRSLQFEDVGSGPAIVWIHGFPLDGDLFRHQASIPGWRHVIPDLPGFGRSAPFGREVGIDAYASVVLALMDDLRIDRAVLAGVSMGGYVLFAMMRIAPERARALLLCDTRETADSEAGQRDRLESIVEVTRKGTAALIESMLPKMLTPATLASNDSRVSHLRSIMERASVAGVVEAQRAMASRVDSTPTLGGIEAPALVLVGESDPITTPDDAKRMQSMLKHGELSVIAEAAHLANLEQPGAFNATVLDFLNRHAGKLSAEAR